MNSWRKLGIIAGGGELPIVLAEHCAGTGAAYFVAAIAPYADARLASHPGAIHGLGAMGARMRALREAGCDALVLVGQVPRQDPLTLQLDDGGRAMVPALLAAAPKGDDALLRAVLSEHERAGFAIVGVEVAMRELLASAGVMGVVAPSAGDKGDIAKAARVAEAIGALDIGQGAIVCDGVVLAVEAQEGTDAMLRRVAELPAPIRGAAGARRGVLVKRPKPNQELRVDLPTIGVKTIEGAAAACLAGIAVQADKTLIVRKSAVLAAADEASLFLFGFHPEDVDEA